MIKLLIFDAGDVLIERPGARWLTAYRAFNRKWHITPSAHTAEWERVKADALTGRLNLLEAHKRVFYKLGLPLLAALEWHNLDKKLINKLIHRKRHIIGTLARLKAAGYKLAILSDSVHTERTKRRILQTLGLERYFDAVFCSCDIKHVKPEPEAYLTVLRHFKVEPAEAVFIGHAADELAGAAHLGIRTIAIEPERGSRADFCVKRFSQIPAVLARL